MKFLGLCHFVFILPTFISTSPTGTSDGAAQIGPYEQRLFSTIRMLLEIRNVWPEPETIKTSSGWKSWIENHKLSGVDSDVSLGLIHQLITNYIGRNPSLHHDGFPEALNELITPPKADSMGFVNLFGKLIEVPKFEDKGGGELERQNQASLITKRFMEELRSDLAFRSFANARAPIYRPGDFHQYYSSGDWTLLDNYLENLPLEYQQNFHLAVDSYLQSVAKYATVVYNSDLFPGNGMDKAQVVKKFSDHILKENKVIENHLPRQMLEHLLSYGLDVPSIEPRP